MLLRGKSYVAMRNWLCGTDEMGETERGATKWAEIGRVKC